jgi:hypothetical protein
MKRLYRLTAVAAGLLLAGRPSVAPAQDAPENHDLQFSANKGSPRMIVQTKAGVLTYQGTDWVQLTAGSITIPAGQAGYLLTTFSGESRCAGTSGWCSLRVLVENAESHPIVGTNFAFDAAGSDQWESHSIQRISDLLGEGTYTIQVQWRLGSGTPSFQVDDWLRQVEYLRAS